MTVYTTLNKIRAFELCEDGWDTLLKSVGKTAPDDEPLALVSILESIGLDDALWCTRTVLDEHRDKIVRFAIGCAENVLPVFEKARPNDLRPRQAIQAAKDYLEGKNIKPDEVDEVAWAAAWSAWAVWVAADAAGAAELKFQEDLFRKIFGEVQSIIITPYEPNPAKAISDCKGDINKLAMAFEVHKCRSVFTELHLASVVNLLERQGTENLNSTDALILLRAKEHVHAIQYREASNAA